ncbi:MAG TPA: glucokinase, partial [Burkholderiaceae bacterium]|nr:glucokinase [Burkholderiaceae bacterium]
FRHEQFPDLASVLRSFLQQLDKPCKRAAVAVALPVRDDRLEFTNRAWTSSATELRSQLDLTELRIVNDFAAAAAGLVSLSPDEVELICGEPRATAAPPAPKVLLGPGTGLGVAAVLPHSPAPVIVPSEAGHMGCYPVDAVSMRVIVAAHEKWGRVSWERLVSGPGLAWIDQCVREAEEPLAPEQVVENAQRGERNAKEAVRVFSALLGAFAGDICLAFGGDDGVYLGGGVLEGLGAGFAVDAFTATFSAKGRFAQRLARVPVFRLRAQDLAFRGLLGISSGAVAVPGLRVVKGETARENGCGA